jgi:dihydropteroate synthase
MTQVMGVLNVTPDSFSDGGRFADTVAATEHALRLTAQGADWIDVGGESTRPGAEPVGEAEELARVRPVLRAVRAASPVALSIDTAKPAVARAAVAAGAGMWNDVTALAAPGAPEAAAQLGCEVVLMHMRGTPLTMQDAPRYADVVGEVEAFLLGRAAVAVSAGVAPGRIWLDPGIGFGKTLEHNLALMNAVPRLAAHGFRVLVGASRKRTVLHLDPTATDPGDRLGGSLALALHAAANGAAMVRVHDVRETRQALTVQGALAAQRSQGCGLPAPSNQVFVRGS